MGDGEHTRYFPKGVLKACTITQHKSPEPKVKLIVANSKPDARHQLDGKFWIWQVCIKGKCVLFPLTVGLKLFGYGLLMVMVN